MFLPPGTFGSYIFAKAARDAGNRADAAFAETGTLPWLTRKHGPFEVAITIRAKRLPTGVLPLRLKDHALDVIGRAFPGVIEDCGDALSGALMNAGPIIHPPLITMNAAPLEHFERWDIHKEGTQAATRRVTDALDAERIAVRAALGYGAPHFPLADHYAREGDEWMYGRGSHDKLTDSGDWREHIVLTQHRYMLEDVRIGLSFLVSVGDIRRRADAARARVPGDRECGVRRGFHADGTNAAELGLGATGSRRAAAAPQMESWPRLSVNARPHRLPRCRADGARHRGRVRLCGAPGRAGRFQSTRRYGIRELSGEALGEVRNVLGTLASFGLFDAAQVDSIAARVSVVPEAQAEAALSSAGIIFEGVPEVLDLKREALGRASKLAGPTPIIASTTSTILVDDLSGAVAHPERFLNAHWLNPAFLVPLVEISPGKHTDAAITERVKTLLERVGKVPVVCAARPGYIVPRIQALAMNEAARMVEEGVASAEDLDKAIKYGFGIRFAVLGMLEFIDWGGGDILYYASRYLTGALESDRFASPKIVERNMAEGRIGLKTGAGFLNYEGLDVEAYRRERLKAFVELLGHFGMNRPPVL